MSASDEAASGVPDDTTQTEDKGERLPPLTSSSLGALANKLGLNPALRAKMMADAPAVASEEAVATEAEPHEAVTGEEEALEATTETEGVEAEAEGVVEAETETDEGEEDEEDGDEEKAPDLKKLQTKAYKQRKRAQRAEKRAADLEARATQLEAQLEKASPIVVTPSIQDPLVNVTDLESLDRQKAEFRAVRDRARTNPKGWVENEGKDNEKIVTSEEAAWWLGYTEDILSDHFPRKEREIREVRPAATNEARRILPTMFDKSSEDYQAAQLTLRAYPWLASNPEKDYLLAVFLTGWKTDLANQQAKSSTKAPAAILKAHNDKGKVPTLKHSAPGPRTQAPSPKGTVMANVYEKHIKSGGGRESLVASLKALRGLEGQTPKSSAPV